MSICQQVLPIMTVTASLQLRRHYLYRFELSPIFLNLGALYLVLLFEPGQVVIKYVKHVVSQLWIDES